MKHILNGSLMGVLFLLIAVMPVKALPIISVDMDPGAGGVQSTLDVILGTTFTVDVVIGDDGALPTTIFDTVILEVSYNDAGAVLAPGPTGPLGGTLASNSPLTLDVFGFRFTETGDPLTISPFSPPDPQLGFASGSGAIGLADTLRFIVAPGSITSIFSIDFVASALGSSSILAAGTPVGNPELALDATPIFAELNSGTVNVNPVPEPATILLLTTGMLGMGVLRRKKLKKKLRR